MINFKTIFIAIIFISLSMLTINKSFAIPLIEATKGTIYCGGNYTKLPKNFINSIWAIRNFNPAQSIFLNSVKFIDATGTVLYDSTTHPAGIPPSNNGLVGGLDNELKANQSILYRSQQLVAASLLPKLTQKQQPIQLIIMWSAVEKVIGLDGALIIISRLIKTVETSPGIFITVQGRESARHQADCRNLK